MPVARRRPCRNGQSSTSSARLAQEARTVFFPGLSGSEKSGGRHGKTRHRGLDRALAASRQCRKRPLPSEPFPSPRGLALLWLQAGLLARLPPPPAPSHAALPAQWLTAGFVWLTAAGGCTGIHANTFGKSTGFPFHLLPEQGARHLKATPSYDEIRVYTMQ